VVRPRRLRAFACRPPARRWPPSSTSRCNNTPHASTSSNQTHKSAMHQHHHRHQRML
jgi:hypothetical protein